VHIFPWSMHQRKKQTGSTKSSEDNVEESCSEAEKDKEKTGVALEGKPIAQEPFDNLDLGGALFKAFVLAIAAKVVYYLYKFFQ
jgi:hypothetical protein